MKRLTTALAFVFLCAAASADDGHTMAIMVHADSAPQAGKPQLVTLTLTHTPSGRPVKPRELDIAHTMRLHLLVIDPTLTDYQHIHPQPGRLGRWTFDFTPKKDGGYILWADVTPHVPGKQEFLRAELGTVKSAAINKTPSNEITIDNYTFTLSFDEPLKAGEASMGTIRITRDGQPVKTLQPVMGAFAHIVGFSEDLHSVLHVHPMGDEPSDTQSHGLPTPERSLNSKSDGSRQSSGFAQAGGPELMFHIEPISPGFIKLFAQVNIDGKEIFAPFGVIVH